MTTTGARGGEPEQWAVLDYSSSSVTMLGIELATAGCWTTPRATVRVLLDLPSVSRAADVEMDIVGSASGADEQSLHVQVEKSQQSLWIPLPRGVDPDACTSRWSKRNLQLTVTLPIHCAGALHATAAAGDVPGVRTLVEAMVDPNARSSARAPTALMAAAAGGHLGAVDVLCGAKGVDLEAREATTEGEGDDEAEGGGTALALAVWGVHETVVARLLEAGAKPNTQDVNGETPLMIAARVGHTGIVEALLGAGADAKMRDNNGWTAAEKAEARGASPLPRPGDHSSVLSLLAGVA